MTAGAKKVRRRRRLVWAAATVFFVILLFLAGGTGYYAWASQNKTLAGLKLGSREIGGRSSEDINQLLLMYQLQIDADGFVFQYQDKKIAISSLIVSTTDPDISQILFALDIEKTVSEIWQYGHRERWWQNLTDYFRALTGSLSIQPHYYLNRNLSLSVLRENFSIFDKPAQNPIITARADKTVSVAPERAGEVLEYEKAIAELTELIEQLDNRTIQLAKTFDQPTIKTAETTEARQELTGWLKSLPWKLAYENKDWTIDNKTVANWFRFVRGQENRVTIDLDREGVAKFLDEVPGPEVTVPAKEGKFKLEDGRVVEFQVGQSGLAIDVEATLENMRRDFLEKNITESQLAVAVTEPQTKGGKTEGLGIKELVAEGRTNFRGSSYSRIHNITVGADTLNGLLIKPGEEFSLVSALGKVDASTGYKSEMVIKGTKTVPEYGGGLCQIGTTTFRVSLNAGVPILERQNHSYRVSYYEPPIGMDATIYGPKPDFRFVNDYASHLLLQTRIEGTEVIFEFYGTKDGRKVELSEPRAYNYVKPPPTKIVETEDLAPGEKKCTERARTGVDAEFTYRVTYPSSEVKEIVYKSHYKAWPEVCLVGKQPETEPANSETPPSDGDEPSPSTNANANSNSADANSNVNANSNANSNLNSANNTNVNQNNTP